MTRVLSTEEIRRWVNSNFTRGKTIEKVLTERELPMSAFCRTVGINPADLTRFKKSAHLPSHRVLRLISRFIGDWESGMLEFGGRRERGRFLVHRETPKPRPGRMTLSFTTDGPRLKTLPRPPASPRIILTAKAK